MVNTESFDNWDDIKDAHNRTVTEFIKNNKLKGSPVPRNWLNKGGSLVISTLDDGTQIWAFTMGSHTVSYVPIMLNGQIVKVIKIPGEYLYTHNDFAATFTIDEGFSDNRSVDMKNNLNYLDKTYGIDEIPKGYVLHHDIMSGAFQLVNEDIHRLFSRYSGHYYNNLPE